MPLQFNDGIQVAAPRYLNIAQGKIVNGKSVPYDSTTELLDALQLTRRTEGTPYFVRNGSVVDEYYFVGGIANSNLIRKQDATKTDLNAFNGYVTTNNAAVAAKVDKTTTIAGKALSSNITLAKTDITGIENVDNTSDANKPVSTAQAAAIALKADVTALAAKSDITYVDTNLAQKLDLVKKPLITTTTALRALSTAAPDVIYQTTDLGGGNWYYDAADTTTPDDGVTVLATTAGGRMKRVGIDAIQGHPVDWYGVTGDGTDESAAVQAMFNNLPARAYLKWGNKTYRFYGVVVPSNIKDLEMEFLNTTWCYPVRNAGTTPTEWYRFNDSNGYQNFQIRLTDVTNVLLKGNLLFDGEARLGNKFHATTTYTGAQYSGEGLAPIILVNAYNLGINSLLPLTKTVLVPASATATSDGFSINNTTAGYIKYGQITFTVKPYYKYLLKYTVALSSGVLYDNWDADNTVHSAINSGDQVIAVPASVGSHTYKFFCKDATVGTITNLRVEEISPTQLDSYIKTEGNFKLYDHGFCPIHINADTSPSYKLVHLKDWTWEDTPIGGHRVVGFHGTIIYENFYQHDLYAKTWSADFTDEGARGTSISAASFTDSSTWPNSIILRNINLNFHQGYFQIYTGKSILIDGLTCSNWGKYLGGDGNIRNLGENTGSAQYDITWPAGGQVVKFDQTYYQSKGKFTINNMHVEDSSSVLLGNALAWNNLWFQSSIKNGIVSNCKFDSLVKAGGQGDFDATTQSWSFRNVFESCEFNESANLQLSYATRVLNCRFTRIGIIKNSNGTPISGATTGTEYPYPQYTDTKIAVYLDGAGSWDNRSHNSIYGYGDVIDYSLFSNCFFDARNFSAQFNGGTYVIFEDCIFQNGTKLMGRGRTINKYYHLFFKRSKRLVLYQEPINAPFEGDQRQTAFMTFDDSEIIIDGFAGIADLLISTSNIRLCFDTVTYKWNNLKIFDKAGNLMHDLVGFQWLKEPTDVNEYGIEGTYYETDFYRWDYTNGAWKVKAKETPITKVFGTGSGATATAVLTGVALNTIKITAGGTGYTSAPAVSFTGGGGTGATGVCFITGDAVTSIYLTNPGSGYTSAPTVVLTGGAGTGATATVALQPQTIASITVNTGGTNYAPAPIVTLSGGSGTGAKAHAVLTGGVVTSIVVDNPGDGFYSVPTVTLSGAADSGAIGTVNIPLVPVPKGFYIDEILVDVGAGLTAGAGSIINFGISTDAPQAGLDDTEGAVTTLNSAGITKIITSTYTKATTARSLVMTVKTADITAGTITVSTKLKKLG